MKKSKQIVIAIVISIFTVGMVKGFQKEFLKSDKVSENILTVLKDNCDCKAITQTMYSKGIIFNKEDGFFNESVDYELTECKYANFNAEVKRVEQLLQDEVVGIKDFDLIVLDFVNEDGNYKSVTITNNYETSKE